MVNCQHRFSLLLLVCMGTALSAPYTELVPRFNRARSNAMVRNIPVPTLAALDYAAYNDNPVLFEPNKYKPRPTLTGVTVNGASFDGALLSPVGSLNETPLTSVELQNPLAWRPLTKQLWDIVKSNGFTEITSKINSFNWGDPSVTASFQQLSTVWLHKEDSVWQFWGEIEISPWAKCITGATDNDSDGVRELYGRLNCDALSPSTLDSAITWITTDYMVQTLSHEQVIDWITELASYWYPSKNTDILEDDPIWPNHLTEKKVKKTMRGVTVNNPVAIVRGRPFGTPIYNIYTVDVKEKHQYTAGSEPTPVSSEYAHSLDTSSVAYMQENARRFAKELQTWGSYKVWADSLKPVFNAQKQLLQSLPKESMGYEGKEGWLFFRKDLEYNTAGDLSGQPYEQDPVAHLVELKTYLEKHNISLLFVPVPNKTEVYYEYLPFTTLTQPSVIINPFSRKILADLEKAGVEVVDLLPKFLSDKVNDTAPNNYLYQKQDTHWTSRGLQITATAIADRIRSFNWYPEFSKNGTAYTFSDTVTLRQGDIVDRLPESARVHYPPVELMAQQVLTPQGTLFKSSKDATITLIGDSFTGVFESVDCKSAGVGAAIAGKVSLPVDIITSWGGGPMVLERFIRNRQDVLGSKRVVIYMMVARDLFNYEQGWTSLPKSLEK